MVRFSAIGAVRRLAGSLWRDHRAFVLILALAAAVRIATAVAYRPALMWTDSWVYLRMAWEEPLVQFRLDRPSGYPALIDGLTALVGNSVAFVVALQHAGGLALGVLVYALLLRSGVGRTVAAIAAGIVLLDAYAIALEQHILAESSFALAVFLAAYLVLRDEPSLVAGATSGLLLGVAATVRPAALYAVPFWLLFLVLRRRRLAVRAVVALAAPLILYCSIHAADSGRFSLLDTSGWFLYGRIAAIADCRSADIPPETRVLCDPGHRDKDPNLLIYSPKGPARRAFGGSEADVARGNTLLRRFSFAIVRAHPIEYAELVSRDFARYFTDAPISAHGSEDTVVLPSASRERWIIDPEARNRFLPGFKAEVHPPAGLLHRYWKVLHLPGWLLAALVTTALAAIVLPLLRRRGPSLVRRAETAVLWAMGMALIVGPTVTVQATTRYLIPAIPLLVCAAVLAAADLRDALRVEGRVTRLRPSGRPGRRR